MDKIQRYGRQYPWMVGILPVAAELLYNLPRETDLCARRCNWELEGRFGRYYPHKNQFVPGVTCEFFETTLNTLDSFSEWKDVRGWQLSNTYYYEKDGKQWRTEVTYGDEMVHTFHHLKHAVQKCDLETDEAIFGDVRVCLSVEEPIDDSTVPDKVDPLFIRRKLRKRFFYASAGNMQPTWSFDMTIVNEGKTMAEIEDQLEKHERQYEIECECIDIWSIISDGCHDCIYVIVSLLLKLKDFIQPKIPSLCVQTWKLLRRHEKTEIDWANPQFIPICEDVEDDGEINDSQTLQIDFTSFDGYFS